MLGACDCLCPYYDIMEGNGRTLSRQHLQDLLTNVFVASGGSLAPKYHLWMHLAHQMDRSGTMRFGSTYPDESLNGALAKVCRATPPPPSTLPLMCLKKYSILRGVQEEEVVKIIRRSA